jgi:hypothetical protein
MSGIRSLRQRVGRLERSPRFQPPPPPPTALQQIHQLAIQHLSDEELRVLIDLYQRQEGGLEIGPLAPIEVAAIKCLAEANETEARRMGFPSYARAGRGGRPGTRNDVRVKADLRPNGTGT